MYFNVVEVLSLFYNLPLLRHGEIVKMFSICQQKKYSKAVSCQHSEFSVVWRFSYDESFLLCWFEVRGERWFEVRGDLRWEVVWGERWFEVRGYLGWEVAWCEMWFEVRGGLRWEVRGYLGWEVIVRFVDIWCNCWPPQNDTTLANQSILLA